MGYKVNRQDLLGTDNNLFTFEIDQSDSIYVELPQDKNEDYTKLKNKIYKLDIDKEEKANIINKINQLKTNISNKEKKQIIQEIEEFKKSYL
jgi:predicted ribosome quality control (RQC) complex YloA/Tae2 family protein